MPNKSNTDPIIHRQRGQAQQARQRHQQDLVQQRDRAELVKAGNRVAAVGEAFELEQRADPAYLAKWVSTIGELQQALANRGLLGKLSTPPAGVTEHELDAWQKAVAVLNTAGTDHAKAVAMLTEVATLPDFAMTVGAWLRGGIMDVIQAYPHPLLRPVASRPSRPVPVNAMPTIYYHGDRTYSVGQSQPYPVGDTEDCLLQAFIGRHVLDKPALADRSGVEKDNIPTALKRLKQKHNGLFATAIYCPGPTGKGQGYRANVVDARPGKAD